MERAGTSSRRFPSKFLLTVIPGLVASGVAASVLYAVHVTRAPSSYDVAVAVCGADRVLAPALLGLQERGRAAGGAA